MPRFSITVSDDLDEYLENLYGDGARFDNKSEVVRHLVKQGRELEALDTDLNELQDARDHVDELEDRLESREERIEDLEDQLRRRRERQENVSEIVEYVEEERELRKQERLRQEKQATAGIGKRAYWWLFGMDLDDKTHS